MNKPGNNIYFISDIHLGMNPPDESHKREKLLVQWLKSIEEDVAQLWLLGDVFDYWFEYRKVIPRGFTRFLGKLAELSDRGTDIHFFTGNHDVWIFDYLAKETGATIHHEPVVVSMGEKRIYLAHGDGLNKKDHAYLLLKSIFRSRFLQWCYARIHPNGATAFAQWWSKKSRMGKGTPEKFKGREEDQILFAMEHSKDHPEIDLYIFGHRHIPFDIHIGNGKRVINLGDWIWNFSYGVLEGKEFRLERFTDKTKPIIKEDFS